MVARTGKAAEAQVADLYREGAAIDVIIETVGVSRPTVWRIIHRFVDEGVLELREDRAVSDEEVAALRAAGMPGSAIASKLGFSRSYIHKVIRRLEDEGSIDHVDVRNDLHAQKKLASPDTPPSCESCCATGCLVSR